MMNRKQKTILTIIGLGILGYFFLKKKKKNTYKPTAYESAVDEAERNGTGIIKITLEELLAILYNRMKQSSGAEEYIIKSLENLTEDDYKYIFDLFGKKTYNKLTKGEIIKNFHPKEQILELNLTEWLKHELSEANYTKLKAKFPNFL